ncbi:MAG: DNA repair protein RecN [Chloroflexi bacterium]|nr:DNA repair protein RecN [Chloroflexota bacterium]
MLKELRIEDFAIIDQLEITLEKGLTTFTGETGAGKSIILDAIVTLLGGRADNEFIRAETDRAVLEAVFQIPPQNRLEIQQVLSREEILESELPDEITLGRELRQGGRSIARINGHSVNVRLLQEIGSFLVDIHGQSEHLSLLNERSHLALLDRYAGVQSLVDEYQIIYHRLTGIRHELNDLRKNEQEAARQKDFLTYQIGEITNARLIPGEDETLRHERDRLANAENLASLTQQIAVILEGGGPDAPAVLDMLGDVVRLVTQLTRLDPSQNELQEQISSSLENLNDAAVQLQDYLEKVEYNPRRLAQVEERLSVLNNLKRKYGVSIEDISSFSKNAQERLERLNHADERIAEIEKEETVLLDDLTAKALALSKRRRKAARMMAEAVEKELKDLNLVDARFTVNMQFVPDETGLTLDGKKVRFDQTGADRVAFLIAPNPGEGYKPLVKIASGGETSRIMLALKNVLAQADFIPTLIFDEIDQGIGGRVGSVVGEKLWMLSQQHQVLCVTHLPQLAAFGAQHFCVYKEYDEGRTYTRTNRLDSDARIEEMTKMFGQVSPANRQAASETLKYAHQRIAELTKSE